MSKFDRMRSRLVDAGLLDAGFNVTPAGDAYTDELLAELATIEAPEVPPGQAVRWNTSRGKFRA